MSKGFLPIVAVIIIAAVAFAFVATRPTSNIILEQQAAENGTEEEIIPEAPQPFLQTTGLVTESQEINYRLHELSPVKNYSVTAKLYRGYRWGAMPITYHISSEGLNVPSNYYDAVRNAAAFWSGLSAGKISFEEVSSKEAAALDLIFDTNYLIEHDQLGGVSAFIGYEGAVPYATSADVRISSPSNDCQAYWQAAHEIGHALGLSHSNEKESIMYGYGDSCIGTSTSDVNSAIGEMYVDFPDRPDLRVNYAQILRIGGRMRLWYDIVNIGLKESGIYDAGLYSGGNKIQEFTFTSIAPGGRDQGSYEFEIPANSSFVTLVFAVDDSSTIAEIDEDDNFVELFAEA